MEIKLLLPGYKNDEQFYQDFLDNKLWESEYISEQDMWIPYNIPDFPIYFSSKDEKKKEEEFLIALRIIRESVISLERDCFMDECFWHSILCLYKREYLLEKYPEIRKSYKNFKNIVIKKFDWENYIYRSILIAQYVEDFRPDEREKYYHIILQNLDMFNYIIKYEIFRNGAFLINIMDIIDETDLSAKLKARIKDRSGSGEDKRYGRQVIYELNRSYPIIMSPMMKKDELKKYFLRFLSYYTDESEEVQEESEEAAKEEVREETNTVDEIKPVEEEVGNDLKANVFQIWLKKDGFADKVIDIYASKMEEINEYWKKKHSEIYDVNCKKDFLEIMDQLPLQFKKGRYSSALKYYIMFLKSLDQSVESSTKSVKMVTKPVISKKDMFEQWLRSQKFPKKFIELYLERLEELNDFCKQKYDMTFYNAERIESIKMLIDNMPEEYQVYKYEAAIKCYLQFIESIMPDSSIKETVIIKEKANENDSLEVKEKREMQNTQTIHDFEKWLKEKGCTDYAASMYILNLKHLQKTCREMNLKELLEFDVSEVISVFNGFPNHLKSGKYRTTINYYCDFLEENR